VRISKGDFSEVSERLIGLCDMLGLDFAAADFMRHPETGAPVFLEVNSQPMFAAFDKIEDGRMSDAIIDTLSKSAKSSGRSDAPIDRKGTSALR
jgi:hypothetical protein